MVHQENISNWFQGWSRNEIIEMTVRERQYWNERARANLTQRNEAMEQQPTSASSMAARAPTTLQGWKRG